MKQAHLANRRADLAMKNRYAQLQASITAHKEVMQLEGYQHVPAAPPNTSVPSGTTIAASTDNIPVVNSKTQLQEAFAAEARVLVHQYNTLANDVTAPQEQKDALAAQLAKAKKDWADKLASVRKDNTPVREASPHKSTTNATNTNATTSSSTSPVRTPTKARPSSTLAAAPPLSNRIPPHDAPRSNSTKQNAAPPHQLDMRKGTKLYTWHCAKCEQPNMFNDIQSATNLCTRCAGPSQIYWTDLAAIQASHAVLWLSFWRPVQCSTTCLN